MHKQLIKDNTIIITDVANKQRVIEYISNLDYLVDIRVMDFNEILENYYFTYNEKTIYYLMRKYHFKYDVAFKYIKNMYYIDKSSKKSKINKIYELKEELKRENLLEFNPYFKNYLASKNIIFYNIDYVPKMIRKIIPNYEVILEPFCNHKHKIYELDTLEDEVSFVAGKIASLIQEKKDINKIYLTNLNDEYRLIIKRIFSMYHIPVALNSSDNLYQTRIGQLFLTLYESDVKNTLKKLQHKIKDDDIDIYNQIIGICNKYVWCNDYLDVKELVIQDLKKTKLKSEFKLNCVREIPFGCFIQDDEYIFLLGFNEETTPITYKDEDYLTDLEKEKLDLETSVVLNIAIKNQFINHIKRYNNLVISYKNKSLTDTYTISNLNEQLEYEVIKDNNFDYHYSHLYNKLTLAKSIDLFNKYGTINSKLTDLYGSYKSFEYRSYDNKFKGINPKLLYQFLNNKLLLSYSSLDNYYRCHFRYYLANILKITPYEESFMQLIGNLFHYVLSKAFTDNFDYDTCFDGYINKPLSKKEQFFIKNLKEELKFIIDTIKEHNTHTKLTDELYEEKIYVDLKQNIDVTFMGIIDKLKYKKIDGKYIISIIDYKTGNPILNLNNIIYGIDMQLPIYLYLAFNHPNFDKIAVAGFYLQKILNNQINADKKYTYEQLKKNNLLLQGYSNENIDILSLFDDSFEESKVVKGLKTSSKGFYAYSKVVSNQVIDKLINLASEKIMLATKDILEADFTINPKRIGYNNVGCEFCSFKDICFKTEKDIVNLQEYKKMEFLEGDSHA